MSFSPVLRVRKFLDKMKTDRGDFSPLVGRLKRSPPSRTSSAEMDSSTNSPNVKLGRKGSQGQADFMEVSFDGENYESQFLSQVFQSQKTKSKSKNGKEEINQELENPFDYLPQEAILAIFSFLNPKTLLALRYLSRDFCSLADDDLTWKHLCIRELGVKVTLENCNWKTTYLVLESIFTEGEWRGFSKWVDPPTFDNEQRTSARLNFLKRTSSSSTSATSSPMVSRSNSSSTFSPPSRSNSASTSDTPDLSRFPSITPTSSSSSTSSTPSTPAVSRKRGDNENDEEFKIDGTGITINCENPSPFGISGDRISMDGNGMKFKWNKNFDKHTSVYDGYMNFKNRTVEGTISYHDGHTHWKGIFQYTKCSSPTIQNKKNNIKKKFSKSFTTSFLGQSISL